MTKYSERTLRRKARNAGYCIEKGFQHWLSKDYPIYTYPFGERETGYNITDLATNTLVYGCHNGNVDHLFSLDDVEEFLTEVYAENGLVF